MARDTRLVYSTDQGRVRETPAPSPPSAAGQSATGQFANGQGPVLIRRETKGRKGKGVTTVSGLPLDATELKSLASRLKQLCGTGGAVKDDVIEIQGDHRVKLQAELQSQGYTVKLAGG